MKTCLAVLAIIGLLFFGLGTSAYGGNASGGPPSLTENEGNCESVGPYCPECKECKECKEECEEECEEECGEVCKECVECKEGKECEECEDECSDEDLKNAYQQGYLAGLIAGSAGECGELPSCEPATLSPELVLTVPLVKYDHLFGEITIWLEFKFDSVDEEKILFELTDFGMVD